MESLGGTVGLVTAAAGATRNPIFAIPEFWMAWTWMGMERPCDATAPGVGEISVTCSACRFLKKMKIVSAAKLPAPSVARPTIMMLPPAPETAGDVLRVARGVRQRDGGRCDVALDAANVARRLARPHGQGERADAQQCGTASDSNQTHSHPL